MSTERRNGLEPYANAYGVSDEHRCSLSIAVSLKRIADALEAQNARANAAQEWIAASLEAQPPTPQRRERRDESHRQRSLSSTIAGRCRAGIRLGLPLCIAFGLISIPVGSGFLALVAIAWKGVFG